MCERKPILIRDLIQRRALSLARAALLEVAGEETSHPRAADGGGSGADVGADDAEEPQMPFRSPRSLLLPSCSGSEAAATDACATHTQSSTSATPRPLSRLRGAASTVRAAVRMRADVPQRTALPTGSLPRPNQPLDVGAALTLEGLVAAERFDAAVALAVAFDRELRGGEAARARAAAVRGGRHGLALVTRALAAHAAALQREAATGGAPTGGALTDDDAMTGLGEEEKSTAASAAWRQLRLVLLEYDSEASNYEMGAAAVQGALSVLRADALPAWLLDYFGAGSPSWASSSAPPPPGSALELRVSCAAAGSSASVADADERVRNLIARFPALRSKAVLRRLAPRMGCVGREGYVQIVQGVDGGDALMGGTREKTREEVAVPDPELLDAVRRLEAELRTMDAGSWQLRRNPAALCRALLGAPTGLGEAMRQLRKGCEAAVAERDRWGATESEARARWVTDGLLEQLYAVVAQRQGVSQNEVDAQHGIPGEPHLDEELKKCFGAIGAYVAPERTTPATDAPTGYVRLPRADEPRKMSSEELFLQFLESATRGG